jgi:hypothetical protein
MPDLSADGLAQLLDYAIRIERVAVEVQKTATERDERVSAGDVARHTTVVRRTLERWIASRALQAMTRRASDT